MLSGGVGFAIYLLVSSLLFYRFSIAPVPSALVAILVSVFPTYAMQRRLTFKGRNRASQAFFKYILLQAVNAGVIAIATDLCTSVGTPEFFSFVIAGMTGAAVSFVAQERLIFGG